VKAREIKLVVIFGGICSMQGTPKQLIDWLYEQDKDKSTTYRAMSGAAWGFRLR